MRLRIPDRRPIDYQFPRDNATWADHRLRVRITAQVIAWLEADSVIDPACGDGSIIEAAHGIRPFERIVLSDLSKPNIAAVSRKEWLTEPAIVGGVEEAFEWLDDPVDVIVLTEFLEHVEDPLAILRLARPKGRYLVASSPLFDEGDAIDTNAEHLWMYSGRGFEAMLAEAGWTAVAMIPLYFESIYDFQIWVAR